MGIKQHGKNKIKCTKYKSERRREKNKIKKIKRHLKNYPADRAAETVLKTLW